MKSKLLLLSFLMLLTVATNYGQTSATVSGIAVQGIARDDNNTALTNESITFRFTIYYVYNGEQIVYTDSPSITTDSFGVFSHVLDVPAVTNSRFANKILNLRIEDVSAGTEISDEVFKHVPYAVSANNGVPTGSIMPFIGTAAPAGWVFCHGQSLTSIDGSEELVSLLGVNFVPDLRGMFMRGTGTNSNASYSSNIGPGLKTIQTDGFEQHNHPGSTDAEANHTHNTNTAHTGEGYVAAYNSSNEVYKYSSSPRTSTPAGGHDHTVTTDNRGIVGETRPINYGVNYIIKL